MPTHPHLSPLPGLVLCTCLSSSSGGGYEHRLWPASLFHRRGMWLCSVDRFSHGNERKGAFNHRTLLRGLLMIPCYALRSGPGSQLSVNVNFYYRHTGGQGGGPTTWWG